jgi:phage baseplate assembly protein W
VEARRRDAFKDTYGSSLPDDICVPLSNTIPRFAISQAAEEASIVMTMQPILETSRGESVEVLPSIPQDILEAVSHLSAFRVNFASSMTDIDLSGATQCGPGPPI